MVKKAQPQLITCFLKEKVHITTSIVSSVQLPDGEIVEAPLILEGYLLDHDDMFVLLGQDNKDSLELIAIKDIIIIKQVVDSDIVMEDPNRPPTEEMN